MKVSELIEIQLAKFLGALVGQIIKGLAWGLGFSISAAIIYHWMIVR